MINLKPTSYLMGKTETIATKVRNDTRVPTLSTPIPCGLAIPTQGNKAGRRNKRNTNK
jgi:hypothetical protein